MTVRSIRSLDPLPLRQVTSSIYLFVKAAEVRRVLPRSGPV